MTTPNLHLQRIFVPCVDGDAGDLHSLRSELKAANDKVLDIAQLLEP